MAAHRGWRHAQGIEDKSGAVSDDEFRRIAHAAREADLGTSVVA